jgi:hypothetical protein
VYIQELHSAANRKQGKVADQGFLDERGFRAIAIRVGSLGFGERGFAVEGRVHVAAAGQ